MNVGPCLDLEAFIQAVPCYMKPLDTMVHNNRRCFFVTINLELSTNFKRCYYFTYGTAQV